MEKNNAHMHVFILKVNNVTTSILTSFPGDFTVNRLVYIPNTYCKALDKEEVVLAVFYDMSKAFDGLLHKDFFKN